jgi:hypothetical protein
VSALRSGDVANRSPAPADVYFATTCGTILSHSSASAGGTATTGSVSLTFTSWRRLDEDEVAR